MKSPLSTVHSLRRISGDLGPFIGLAFVVVFFCIVAPPAFYSFYNIKTIITQTVILGIGALGVTLVIISGGIDLSVGSVIALTTVITARLFPAHVQEASLLLTCAVACGAIVAAAGIGFINGLVSAGFRIVPFIVTLGMMQIARGLAKWLAREQTVLAPENALNRFMEVDPTPSWMVFSGGVWLLIALTVLLWFVLRRTVFGRYVFALGSNENTARLCGIPVLKYRVIIYTLCSAFVGIAGLMQFANLTVGDPTAAVGMELDIIAAVVIGGGSLNGGEGSAAGSLVGALMMAVLRNGCNLVGIPNYVQNILIGAIIIAAVAVDRLKGSRMSS
jgi:ribose/xylose/arabinose/galactoside ABC-type transport system permease subunit